jgi:hypothetical protein
VRKRQVLEELWKIAKMSWLDEMRITDSSFISGIQLSDCEPATKIVSSTRKRKFGVLSLH